MKKEINNVLLSLFICMFVQVGVSEASQQDNSWIHWLRENWIWLFGGAALGGGTSALTGRVSPEQLLRGAGLGLAVGAGVGLAKDNMGQLLQTADNTVMRIRSLYPSSQSAANTNQLSREIDTVVDGLHNIQFSCNNRLFYENGIFNWDLIRGNKRAYEIFENFVRITNKSLSKLLNSQREHFFEILENQSHDNKIKEILSRAASLPGENFINLNLKNVAPKEEADNSNDTINLFVSNIGQLIAYVERLNHLDEKERKYIGKIKQYFGLYSNVKGALQQK